ncbi:hypothetical protein ON010_g14006 [Phytophthora cinnamomi]|nr:hypothetical protein ON010_g14006 [Phytophthora cinnamomi]
MPKRKQSNYPLSSLRRRPLLPSRVRSFRRISPKYFRVLCRPAVPLRKVASKLNSGRRKFNCQEYPTGIVKPVTGKTRRNLGTPFYVPRSTDREIRGRACKQASSSQLVDAQETFEEAFDYLDAEETQLLPEQNVNHFCCLFRDLIKQLHDTNEEFFEPVLDAVRSDDLETRLQSCKKRILDALVELENQVHHFKLTELTLKKQRFE